MTPESPPIDISEVHETHRPEPPERRLTSGVVWCMVCCKLVVSTRRGVSERGMNPCAGRVPLRPFGDQVHRDVHR